MSLTRNQKRFTILEVAAGWHELMIPQRTMRSSVARVSEQVDPRSATSRHTTTQISHSVTLCFRPVARKLILISRLTPLRVRGRVQNRLQMTCGGIQSAT